MDKRLLFLALGMFALGTDSFVVAGVLPEVARSFHISIGAAGQMTTIYAVTNGVLAPVIAALAARVPRKTLLLTGLVIFVLANLATAAAPTFTLAMAMRALAGAAAATFSTTAIASATTLVPPERRGGAIAIVIAGLSLSTALGAPIGTLIGGLSDWHWTMVFVAALAALSALGVAAFMSDIPLAPPVSLAQRLAPLSDRRVGLILASTFLFFTAAFTVYTYLSVVFGTAIGGNPAILSGLLVLWGVAGTVSNFLVGRLVDAIGNRRVLFTMLTVVVADFVLLPISSVHLWSAAIAVAVWGFCGWGMLVPQQHRIVSTAPTWRRSSSASITRPPSSARPQRASSAPSPCLWSAVPSSASSVRPSVSCPSWSPNWPASPSTRRAAGKTYRSSVRRNELTAEPTAPSTQ